MPYGKAAELRHGGGLDLCRRERQDFRGSGEDIPGGLYATIEMHAGLICLNSIRRMDLNVHAR